MTGSQFLEGVAVKEGLTFFRGCTFDIKNKLKSEMFNDKKSFLTEMFASVITKNLKWETLTKNLLTFKGWNGINDENFCYYGGSLKNPIYTEVQEKPI